MVISNEDVEKIVIEIPDGHRHIRTTLFLKNGSELTFQEATISNLLRGFIIVKTHPLKKKIELVKKRLLDKKEGFAEWQLLEN